MTLTLRILGVEILHVDLCTDPAEDDDPARDLSGGTITAERIEAGTTDLYLGFTNGRGDDDG